MRSNFDKHKSYEADVQKTPYDYASIMHYGVKAFTVDGSQTIFPKFNENQQLGSDSLTRLDKKELRKMYECDSKIFSHQFSTLHYVHYLSYSHVLVYFISASLNPDTT